VSVATAAPVIGSDRTLRALRAVSSGGGQVDVPESSARRTRLLTPHVWARRRDEPVKLIVLSRQLCGFQAGIPAPKCADYGQSRRMIVARQNPISLCGSPTVAKVPTQEGVKYVFARPSPIEGGLDWRAISIVVW
jgi:hypothetical protein